MESLLGVIVAVGLAAACGFRVFVPPLLVGIAQAGGHVQLAEGMQWLGSPVAITCFAVATLLEVLAYFVPAVDNLLDTVATPAAVVAGTVVAAAAITDMSPFLRWSLAAVAGGAVAAPIQLATASLRVASTTATAGLGNPLLGLGESVGSGALTLLTVLLPLAGFAMALLCVIASVVLLRRGYRLLRGRSA